jgi:hypothetical protein
MAYDQTLVSRVHELISDIPGLREKKMFGGVGFIINGNMACGVYGDDLIVRVGSEGYAELITLAHTRPFDLTGKPMSGWLLVTPAGIVLDRDLEQWVARGVAFAQTLPAK